MAKRAHVLDRNAGVGDGSGMSRLVEALAADLALLTNDIDRLGNGLSEAYISGQKIEYALALQQFDLISQGINAIARLLDGLGPLIVQDADETALLQLIDKIPFHAARLRLRAALDGTQGDKSTVGEDLDELF